MKNYHPHCKYKARISSRRMNMWWAIFLIKNFFNETKTIICCVQIQYSANKKSWSRNYQSYFVDFLYICHLTPPNLSSITLILNVNLCFVVDHILIFVSIIDQVTNYVQNTRETTDNFIPIVLSPLICVVCV